MDCHSGISKNKRKKEIPVEIRIMSRVPKLKKERSQSSDLSSIIYTEKIQNTKISSSEFPAKDF